MFRFHAIKKYFMSWSWLQCGVTTQSTNQRSFVSHTWLFEHFPTATLLLFAFMNSWLRCDFLAKIVSFMLLFWYYGAFFLLRKWFTIGLIFVILDAFMNFLDMSLQMMWMIKWFATRFTSVIFVGFMKCRDVCLQISSLRKWSTTRLTFMIFVAFMNCICILYM